MGEWLRADMVTILRQRKIPLPLFGVGGFPLVLIANLELYIRVCSLRVYHEGHKIIVCE